MPLKSLYLLLAVSVAPLLKSFSQEYPFIHYTPKDGLINSRIRNVYQDSKGRLFFMTANGLSVYDGARFNNYSVEHGLANPVVNDMLEISPDSLLLATNTNSLNAWVRGRVKTIQVEGFCPIINKFLRARNGTIYTATDQGIFSMHQNRFEKLDLENAFDDSVISFDDIQEIGEYLLVKVNFEMTRVNGLYLLDKVKKKLIPFYDRAIGSVLQVPQFNLLLCSSSPLLLAFDLNAASAGIIRPVELPTAYHGLRKIATPRLSLDESGNVWCLNVNSLHRISGNGNTLVLNKTTGLDVNNMNGIFIDRENVLWIQTDGSGLIKLANHNVEIVTGLFSKSATGISAVFASPSSDTTWLFNKEDLTLYASVGKEIIKYGLVPPVMAFHMIKEKDHFYLFDFGKVYIAKPLKPNSRIFSAQLYFEMEENSRSNLNRAIVDNDYLYAPGPEITVVKDGIMVFSVKAPAYIDQIAIDSKQRLWAATRTGDLLCYKINYSQPNKLLSLEHNYKTAVPYLGARSLTIDTNDKVWVGTRYEGLYCFEFTDSTLIRQLHFTVQEGLTDNFVYYLTCDRSNNIWVGTQSGIDKLSLQNGEYIIEGVTRNNNIFQLIQTISVSRNNQVWSLGNSGSILRITNNPVSKNYRPQLQISRIKASDTTFNMPLSNLTLSHLQNNITFEVAAPSFIDEKQIKFSYLLVGSDNTQWSTPSQEATFNFINLPHGKYKLNIRAFFPVSSYAPQEMLYAFTITPPWWDTWWSRILMAITIVGIMVLVIRFYFKRKLEKQRVQFEKQQAVEQERTRIAMEMHDDLGSGLTTIRYLAGGLSLQTGNSSKEKAEKIASSAKSLVDNMNDIIWTMKSDNNTLTEALAYIRKQAAEQLETAGIDYHIDFPKDLPPVTLTNELKRNLLLISKEAIHNIVKHSSATCVNLSAQLETGKLQLKIVDNGKGINLKDVSTFGNGLKSMRKRAEEIKALLEVMNTKGTTVVVTAPV